MSDPLFDAGLTPAKLAAVLDEHDEMQAWFGDAYRDAMDAFNTETATAYRAAQALDTHLHPAETAPEQQYDRSSGRPTSYTP